LKDQLEKENSSIQREDRKTTGT